MGSIVFSDSDREAIAGKLYDYFTNDAHVAMWGRAIHIQDEDGPREATLLIMSTLQAAGVFVG